VLLEELGYTFFYAGTLRDGNVASEVFDGAEEATVFDDGDSDCVQIWIEEIGAMGGGGHPYLLEVGGFFAVSSDVLGDGGEVGSGVGSAGKEVRLTGILMEHFAGFANDPFDVGARGLGQSAVPMEGREIVRGSGLIG
jgi:hypothetical protein